MHRGPELTVWVGPGFSPRLQFVIFLLYSLFLLVSLTVQVIREDLPRLGP